jgi:hypothetical protein
MLRFVPLAKPIDVNHRSQRSKAVDTTISLLKSFKALFGACPDTDAKLNRWKATQDVRQHLEGICKLLDEEIKVCIDGE